MGLVKGLEGRQERSSALPKNGPPPNRDRCRVQWEDCATHGSGGPWRSRREDALLVRAWLSAALSKPNVAVVAAGPGFCCVSWSRLTVAGGGGIDMCRAG